MNLPDSITIGSIEFLAHTWPLVFGLPAFLILSAFVGVLYEVASREQ